MTPLLVRWLKDALLEVQEYVRLSWAAARDSFSRPFYFHDVVEQLEAIGLGSLALMGMALIALPHVRRKKEQNDPRP